MKNRLYLVTAFLIFLCSRLYAEPDVIYQFNEPTANEYLMALPTILQQAEQDYSTEVWPTPYGGFVYLTWLDLQNRYAPLSDYPYHLLAAVNPYYTINSMSGLNTDLVMAWLRENPVDLDDFDAEHMLNFGDIVIKVSKHDFNADSQDEWVLDVEQGQRYKWKQVISQAATGGYAQIKAPLFIFDSLAPYTSASLDEELAFDDLNQDGLPEWVIAVAGGGGNPHYGYLVILQWQNGQLVNLVPDRSIRYSALGGGGTPIFPYGITVELKDVDHNGTIDIQVVQQEQYDNWGCTWRQTRVFSWHKDQYGLLSETRKYDDIKGCAWRAAETAMWEYDYKTAITQYERGFALVAGAPTLGSTANPDDGLWEYARVRLALAYILNGQRSEAQLVLDDLRAAEIHAGTVQQMSDILMRMIDTHSEEEICQAVYDLWQGYVDNRDQLYKEFQKKYTNEPVYVRYEDVILLGTYVGYIYENYSMPNISGFPIPKPEKAGCDITAYGRSLPNASDKHDEPVQPVPSATPTIAAEALPNERDVIKAFNAHENEPFLLFAQSWLSQIQKGTEGNEWRARYLLATALRNNNRIQEALEQYIYIYENAPLASWRQLAGMYLTPVSQ